MPFGKYKGEYIEFVPREYLEWLWDNITLREPLRSAVYRELHWEDDEPIYQLDKADRIKQIYRQLAFKWHPDRGGSNEAMQAINDFYVMANSTT
jgi:hypothetical protein